MDYYSFNRPQRDGRLSRPCWLTDSGDITSSELACVRSSCQLHVGHRMSSVGKCQVQSCRHTADEAAAGIGNSAQWMSTMLVNLCVTWLDYQCLITSTYTLCLSDNQLRKLGLKSTALPQSYGVSLVIWDHSFTCHQTQVNINGLNLSQGLVLYLPAPDGWKAELT